jgi:2-iminoacetate synthase
MRAFTLVVDTIQAARVPDAPALLARVADGAPCDDETLVALVLADAVPTQTLLDLVRARRPARPHVETFSPLYLTNECDAECRMCGMRGDNAALVRETADAATVGEQLRLLYARGLRGVAVLTGEYRHGARRDAMLARAADAVRAALAVGFEHVLVNIGALDADEYPRLLDGVPRGADGRVAPQLTMCTFQETYHPASYARFMGSTPANPRSDYARRLRNFDRAADAGIWSANPGVLLGLHKDLGFELLALLAHVRHLAARGLRVYVSLPRLRRASGTAYAAGVGEDALARVVAALGLGVPAARVVISTREPPAVQRRLLPVIGVLTPGSPGVAPYTRTGARFELEASQFEVLDHRPIEAILGDLVAAGATVERWEPAAPA